MILHIVDIDKMDKEDQRIINEIIGTDIRKEDFINISDMEFAVITNRMTTHSGECSKNKKET